MRKNLSLLILIFSGIIFLSSVTMGAGGPQIISGIEIEGNQVISDMEILSLIKTQPGDLLDEEMLKADLQRIFDLGYFQDVSVSFQVYQGGLKAVFELVEYPVINDIIIEGNHSFSDEELLSLLGVQKGEILNHNQLLKGKEEIELLYQENGYILAAFTDLNITEEGIITIELNEGYINEIIIEGNEKTKDFVILREMEFSEGDVLKIDTLQNSFQKLARLNLFYVNPRLERVSIEENSADIIIELEEIKTGNFGAGVTYSTVDGWYGFLNISERNFLGRGQTIGFDWQFGGVNNYSIHFQEPWLMGTPTSFGISLYDRTYERKDKKNNVEREYTEKRRGGSISLGREIIDGWDGLIRFRKEDGERIYDKPEYSADNEKTDIRSLSLQLSRDTTNHPFNPTSGAMDIFTIEYAGQMLGGTASFTKYNLDMRRFYPGFKAGHAWGLRLKAGTSDGDLPELEKFKVGGSDTIRGYDNGSFKGEDMILFNIEYRFPITENFTGVIFTDAGNAWDEGDTIDLGELNYSIGAGIRLNTPIGQIRLDYGFNADGEGQPHFSIGHAF